jgi:tartrate dehydratase beta subunit/fumarate hydratase class I family protein
MHSLTIPISEEEIRALHVGDGVLLNGVMLTGRDAAHKYMIDNFVKSTPPDSEKAIYQALKAKLANGVIYHCGPVVRKRDDGRYEFVAAGPTTSIREEIYQADVIEHFGLRAVIGKGGMADKTLGRARSVLGDPRGELATGGDHGQPRRQPARRGARQVAAGTGQAVRIVSDFRFRVSRSRFT